MGSLAVKVSVTNPFPQHLNENTDQNCILQYFRHMVNKIKNATLEIKHIKNRFWAQQIYGHLTAPLTKMRTKEKFPASSWKTHDAITSTWSKSTKTSRNTFRVAGPISSASQVTVTITADAAAVPATVVISSNHNSVYRISLSYIKFNRVAIHIVPVLKLIQTMARP